MLNKIKLNENYNEFIERINNMGYYNLEQRENALTQMKIVYDHVIESKSFDVHNFVSHNSLDHNVQNFIFDIFDCYELNVNSDFTHDDLPKFYEDIFTKGHNNPHTGYFFNRALASLMNELDISQIEIIQKIFNQKGITSKELFYSLLQYHDRDQPKAIFSFIDIFYRTGGSQFIKGLTSKFKTHRYIQREPIVQYIIDKYPETIVDNLYEICINDLGYYTSFDHQSVETLLNLDTQKYGPLIGDLMNNNQIIDKDNSLYLVFAKLEDLGIDFDKKKMHSIEARFVNFYYTIADETGYDYYTYDPYLKDGHFSSFYFKRLFEKNEDNFNKTILHFYDKSVIHPFNLIETLDKLCAQKCVPILIKSLTKESKKFHTNYWKKLFDVLDKHRYEDYIQDAIVFACSTSNKSDRKIAVDSLVKQSPIAKLKGIELMKGKVNERVAGALILSHFPDQETMALLNNTIDNEKNDETRNIIIEAVKDKRFSASFGIEDCKQMIAQAEVRKKLSAWSEKWLQEQELLPLYWSDGEKLDSIAMRFLFYRMKQVKGLNSDIEAKQIFNHLDKSKTEKFALQLINAFIDSNADTKLKYNLTFAGLIGGDGVLSKVDALFRKLIVDKRVKVAEYVLGAMAMIGSDKALRMLDVISRKYAAKKPKLSEVAIIALEAAAEELDITKDQLSDRIIPNFDFEGLFKEYEIGDETYRAFINMDFQLNYFDENNKLRKSLPKDATKEQKAEIKEIEKEVKDVVKSQSLRLEYYLISNRKWEVEEWQQFFLMHPIMFVYANKLLWSAFNEEDECINIFYVSEDAELLDINGDEVDIDDANAIRILHPMHITEDVRLAWKDKLYEQSKITLISQVDRSVFLKNIAEFELNITSHFNNRDVPKGADFVQGFLNKLGWTNSTGDGGSLLFYKTLREPYASVYAWIDGPAAYYRGGLEKATVYDLEFSNKEGRMKIKDVPDIWYSEVMYDIDRLIKA